MHRHFVPLFACLLWIPSSQVDAGSKPTLRADAWKSEHPGAVRAFVHPKGVSSVVRARTECAASRTRHSGRRRNAGRRDLLRSTAESGIGVESRCLRP